MIHIIKKTTVLDASLKNGKEIVRVFKYWLFKNQNTYTSLKEFSAHLKSIDNKYIFLDSDDFLFFLGSKVLDVMINLELIKPVTTQKNKIKTNFFVIADKTLIKHTNETLFTPVKLPMIVKPNPHSDKNIGGYLLNDTFFTDDLILHKPTSKYYSKINNNLIYDAVNGLSSTGFKVNTKVLDFINDNYDIFFEEENQIDLLREKSLNGKLNWRDIAKLKSLSSLRVLKHNIMGIANAYRNMSQIYFPVKKNYILEVESILYHTILILNHMS